MQSCRAATCAGRMPALTKNGTMQQHHLRYNLIIPAVCCPFVGCYSIFDIDRTRHAVLKQVLPHICTCTFLLHAAPLWAATQFLTSTGLDMQC
eukprot:1157004-Pelagomonas_calceolata.AAC.6